MTLLQWLASRNPLAEHSDDAPRARRRANGRAEPLEPRVFLAGDLIVGAVYFEEASGRDDRGDEISVTFAGGADGSQLVRLVLDGDKGQDELGQGDVFFDTVATGQDEVSDYGGSSGTFGAVPFEVVEATGFTYQVAQTTNQLDGSPTIEITFQGFEAGERFVFRIDVDEQGFRTERSSALAEGAEFEDSILTADFTAPHYEDAQVEAVFWDRFTPEFDRLGGDVLDLPPDEYDPPVNPERTAGAIGRTPQIPLPNTISGRVFHDRNLNVHQDGDGEEGLAGVVVELWRKDGDVYVDTGRTATTSADGDYEFLDVEIGEYRLVERQPDGYRSVGAVVGTVDGASRGDVVSADVLTDIALRGGENSIRNDFAEAKEAALSGWVYHDQDDDGLRAAGEEGIAGVSLSVIPVDVVDSAQQVVTVATAGDGSWSASGLSPGEYRVVETVQPAGFLDGLDSAGSLGGVAANPGDEIREIVAPPGASGVEYNFGEIRPSSLSGRVHVDRDGDCVFDPGERPLAGVAIQLLDADGAVVAETTTNAAGEYRFENLRPGRYAIREIQPPGYFDSGETVGSAGGRILENDLIGEIDLAAGVDGVDYDFCELGPASLAGQVFIDLDGDCFRDPEERPAVGVLIELLDAQGQVVDTRLTDGEGQYFFDGLAPGEYGVRETQPEGLLQGGTVVGSAGGVVDEADPDLIREISLLSDVDAVGYDFCEHPPASLEGTVYHDRNVDGDRDPGEEGLADVVISLIDAEGDFVAETRTDAEGRYRFEDLDPGVYGVVESQPEGYLDGEEQIGTAGGRLDGNDRIVDVALTAGVAGRNYDFGELLPGSLAGVVHTVEHPEDCVPGEHGDPLPGVTVQLLDDDGDVLRETITDDQGRYRFDDLPPGEYSIREIQPEGWISVAQHVGTAGGRNATENWIVEIGLLSATVGEQYNFCETTPPVPPEPPVFEFVPQIVTPPPEPLEPINFFFAPPTITPLAEPTPGIRQDPLVARFRPTMTWHLSIVDAGKPRGLLPAASDGGAAAVQPVSAAPTWHTASYLAQGEAQSGRAFGVVGGVPLIGDFDGDGRSDFSIYRDGEWFIDVNRNGVWDEGDLWARLGGRLDLPIVGDWNGDGKSDIGIFGLVQHGDKRAIASEPGLPDPLNPDERRLKNVPPSDEAASDVRREMRLTLRGSVRVDVVDHVFAFGDSVDAPVAGDWNGDGVATIGVYRNGRWFLDVDGDGRFTEADEEVRFGRGGDTPVVGDWNGDGVDDLAVFRDGDWRIDADGDRAEGDGDQAFGLGGAGDVPIAGDWDGDGRDTPSVYQAGPTPDGQAAAGEGTADEQAA